MSIPLSPPTPLVGLDADANVESLASIATSNDVDPGVHEEPPSTSLDASVDHPDRSLSLRAAKPPDWKVQMIESAIRDIARAEFVALDLGNE